MYFQKTRVREFYLGFFDKIKSPERPLVCGRLVNHRSKG